MSPYSYFPTGANVLDIRSDGRLSNQIMGKLYLEYGTYGVRPVVSLKSDVELTGSGLSTDPFIVVGTNESV